MLKCCVLVAVVAMATNASASPWDDTYVPRGATGGGYASCPDQKANIVVAGGKFELPLTYHGDNIGRLKVTVLDSGKTKVEASFIEPKPAGVDADVYDDAHGQTFVVTFKKSSGGAVLDIDSGSDHCDMDYINDNYRTIATPKSTGSSSGAGKKSGSKRSSCVASGGWTSNAGNCCSHRYAHPGKATDPQNQCK